MGLTVRVQSQRDPTYIEERIEAFMVSFEDRLKEMTDEEFVSQKEGLIVKKVERHKNISEETSSFWNRIGSGYYDFTRGRSPPIAPGCWTEVKWCRYFGRRSNPGFNEGGRLGRVQEVFAPKV